MVSGAARCYDPDMGIVEVGLLLLVLGAGLATGGTAAVLVTSRSRGFEAWARDGLITAEQIPALRARDEADATAERRHRIARGLAIVGGVTFGAGVILFFAANWGEIPRLVRLLVLVSGVVGFHALGWWLREVRASLPAVGHALLLVGSILFGASLFLVGQMYHVDTHDPLAWLLWTLGAAAVGLFVRSAPLATLATLAFGGWIVHELVTLGPEYGSYKYIPGALALYGLALYAVGTRTQPWLAPLGFARPLRAIGFGVAAVALLVFSFREAVYLNERPEGGIRTLLIVLALCASAGAAALAVLPPRRTDVLQGAVVAGATGLVALTLFAAERPNAGEYQTGVDAGHPLFFAALLLVLTLGAILVAYFNDELWLAQAAFAFAALQLVARFVDPGWPMLPRSLVFVAVGGAVLALGALLERRRGGTA